jgi:tubulin monoglycylase TTLL15
MSWKSIAAASAVVIFSVAIGYLAKIAVEYKDDSKLLQELLENMDLLSDSNPQSSLKYWGVCINKWNKYDSLRTMNRVFKKLGYENVNASETFEWDILWSIEYPFKHLEAFLPLKIFPLKQHQRINHILGIYRITNKRGLGTFTKSKYLLPTFVFPREHEQFNQFNLANPNAKYVEKNYNNRGVRIVTVDEFNKTDVTKIYQAFMDKPLLIDGHAFDFGVYVIITSVDPLRIYRYDHEVLIRFCPKEYHPFDAKIRHKYVVDDEHLCSYDMPSFKKLYDDHDFSIKNIFNHLIAKRGFDKKKFWLQIDDAITEIIVQHEKFFINEVLSCFENISRFLRI